MTLAEYQDLDACVICGRPVRRGIEVESASGWTGMSCRACLRRYRRAYNGSWK